MSQNGLASGSGLNNFLSTFRQETNRARTASGHIRALGPPWDASASEPGTRSVGTPLAPPLLVFDEGFYRRDFVANFGKLFWLNSRC